MTRTSEPAKKPYDPIKIAKNGTYYFRINLGYDANGKKIQKYKSGFATKKEAKLEYSRLLLSTPEELAKNKKKMLFQEYVEDIYLPWYKTQVKERTYENRLSSINKHFAYFYNIEVNKIEPIHVQNWQIQMSERYKSSYVRAIQCLFSIAMDRAVILGIAESNPSKVIGNVKKQKADVDFWTKEEFEQVISTLYIKDYYQHFAFIFLWLLFMTGMRLGEATALQWADIDFETGVLNINKTLYYKNRDHWSFVEPKTKSSIRQIVVDATTLKYLKEWQLRQQALVHTNFIISYNGYPAQKYVSGHIIQRHSQAAGVHRIRTHALRHSHAALLISMGVNPLDIRDRLGHKDIQTTLGTYGHLYPNSNFVVAKKLDGIIDFSESEKNYDNTSLNQYTKDFKDFSYKDT